MNLSLQDPFAVAQEYPETLTTTLTWGHSVVIQFNHRGDYVASGLSDGSIVIYDITSNGSIVAKLEAGCHTRPVTSISWSTCGRYLLSSSQDWSVKLWDLQKVNSGCAVIREIKFDGPVWGVLMRPGRPFEFVVSLVDDEGGYVRWADTIDIVDQDQVDKIDKVDQDQNGHPMEVDTQPSQYVFAKLPGQINQTILCSSFTPDGSYIFSGTNKGNLLISATNDVTPNDTDEPLQNQAAAQAAVVVIRISSGNIKNLSISNDSRKLAVNSSDRIIRQYTLPDLINTSDPVWDLEIEHKYQDVVNRLQWNTLAFNANAEFLVASTFGQLSHDLYVWETSMGLLVKILEGSNEELIDVKWNHARCSIGLTGLDTGTVYLWTVTFPQKWSALAPDFVEIEENIDYEEKEDEFDIVGEDALKKRLLEGEEVWVDVITEDEVDARGWRVRGGFTIPINYEHLSEAKI